MSYSLTLTAGERKAIDWIGDRYDHGNTLSRLLLSECDWSPIDADWDDPRPLTFTIPEHVAWAIDEIINEGLDCFSPELCGKFYALQESIV